MRPPGVGGRMRLRSATGRRAGRAEDDHPVALGDREQPLQIRRSGKRWRQYALRRRLADLVQEALEVEGLEADQRLRPVGLAEEGVGHAFGAERERAGRERKALLPDVDGELALEHVEPLVLVGVDVPGRALAGADRDLDNPYAPPVSAPLILTISSIPSSQYASPSPLPSM